ncbi:hypothetical protein FIU35_12490, partial [Enterococcus faecium]
SQNVVHSDSDLILHNSSVLIDKEPKKAGTTTTWRSFQLNITYFAKLAFNASTLSVCSQGKSTSVRPK